MASYSTYCPPITITHVVNNFPCKPNHSPHSYHIIHDI